LKCPLTNVKKENFIFGGRISVYHLRNLSAYQPRTSKEIFFIKLLEDFYSQRLTFHVDSLGITPPLKDFAVYIKPNLILWI
jgi:hypothetical protein